VTVRIRRRAWSEPRVRFWWLAAAVLLVVGLTFVAQGIRARFHDAWLIRDGLRIDARVAVANGEPVKDRPQPPDSVVEIQFRWKGDPKYSPRPRPLEGRRDFIITNSILPIHVNPDDPEDWTWLDEPLPMLARMIGGIVAIPLALLALLWALGRQRVMLRIWRHGEAVEALIVESRHTAIAPRSRVARATPADESDARIHTVYLPPRLASLRRGGAICILRLPSRPKRVCAAAWFE
jgi:hypothetical protein